jgi:hypothetical protein
VVDSTERFNIEETDSLLITICPLNQWNRTKLNEFGYGDEYALLAGFTRDLKFIGWGAQHNFSFYELFEKVNNFNLIDPVITLVNLNYSRNNISYVLSFYPKYGWCYDLIDFPIAKNMFMAIRLMSKEGHSIKGEVFITDKYLRTRHTVHAGSHWGLSINIEQGTEHTYLTRVEKISNFDPRKPEDCRNYGVDDYMKCADDGMEMAWRPLYNCNPHWVSSYNQCNGELNVTKETINTYFSNAIETLNPIYNMRNDAFKESCIKSCTEAQVSISLNEKKEQIYAKAENATFLNLIFANEVVYTTKKLAYGTSEFLVDMGSSLGLWFGLSVFGITDLGIMALHWVKKLSFI